MKSTISPTLPEKEILQKSTFPSNFLSFLFILFSYTNTVSTVIFILPTTSRATTTVMATTTTNLCLNCPSAPHELLVTPPCYRGSKHPVQDRIIIISICEGKQITSTSEGEVRLISATCLPKY